MKRLIAWLRSFRRIPEPAIVPISWDAKPLYDASFAAQSAYPGERFDPLSAALGGNAIFPPVVTKES